MATTDTNFFGVTTFRNERKKFGIKPDDRRRHFYLIGKTGMGKTEVLKNMIIQDIQAGNGVGFVDPHGDSAEEILNFIPKERIKDVIYFTDLEGSVNEKYGPIVRTLWCVPHKRYVTTMPFGKVLNMQDY